jgi:hypothetical protein
VVFEMMDRDVPHRLDPECLRALKQSKARMQREAEALSQSAGA